MPRRNVRQITSTTLAEQVYEAMRQAIISGELSPGERITERGLAERFAVSPTPIREALRRLEQDHLVERHGPRSVQITDVGQDAGEEIVLVEGSLRALAARLAAKKATTVQLERMERLLAAGDKEIKRHRASAEQDHRLSTADLAPLLQITRDFHAALNEASNSPVLHRLLNLVDAFSRIHRLHRVQGELRIGADAYQVMVRRYDEHRDMLDAVAKGDAESAERLMVAHCSSSSLDAVR